MTHIIKMHKTYFYKYNCFNNANINDIHDQTVQKIDFKVLYAHLLHWSLGESINHVVLAHTIVAHSKRKEKV